MFKLLFMSYMCMKKKIHAEVMVFACKARIFHYHLGMAVETTNFVLDAMEIIWLCIVFGYMLYG